MTKVKWVGFFARVDRGDVEVVGRQTKADKPLVALWFTPGVLEGFVGAQKYDLETLARESGVDLDQPIQENPRVNLEDGRRVHLEYANQPGFYRDKKPKNSHSPANNNDEDSPLAMAIEASRKSSEEASKRGLEDGRAQSTRESELENKVRELEAQLAAQGKRTTTGTKEEEKSSPLAEPSATGDAHRLSMGAIDVGPLLIQALQSMTEVLREQRSMSQSMATMFTTFMERMAPPQPTATPSSSTSSAPVTPFRP